MAADTAFTRAKLDLLDRIVLDRRASHLACRLADLLGGKYVNRECGYAWPGQETLARELGVCVNTLKTAERQLVTLGYLEIKPNRGRGNTNLYRLTDPENHQPADPFKPKKTVSPTSQNRQFDGEKRVSGLTPNPLKEPPEEPFPSPTPAKNQIFEESSIAVRARSGNGKYSRLAGSGAGSGYPRGSVTIADPLERLARFQAAIARQLGARGWDIVGSAADKADPEHDRNFALCQQAARALGKGWPRLWGR